MTIKLNAATGGGSVSLSAPNSTTSNLDVELTLPVDDGAADTFLKSDGSGTLSWAAASSDSITEGNTTVECVDTGSDGHITFDTEGSERGRFDSSGRLLVGTDTSIVGKQSQQRTLQVAKANASTSQGVGIYHFHSGGQSPNLELGLSKNNTLGSHTAVSSGDNCGSIIWSGSAGTEFEQLGSIAGACDGTPSSTSMPGRLVFFTTPSGSVSPTERMRIAQNGAVKIPHAYSSTTSNAANVYIYGDGELARSTSSQKYKTQIEPVEYSYSAALLDCQPVWYRSTCEKDNPDWGWWGFIAEEVAKIDPRLVHWKTVEVSYDEQGSAVESPCDPEPEGVAYDRFVPHLLNLIKRQKEQLDTQAVSIASLEARLTALEGGAS